MRTARDRKRIRKRTRKRKIKYLRERLANTTDAAARERLIEKLHRVSPTAPVSQD